MKQKPKTNSKTWQILPASNKVDKFAKDLKISTMFAQVLINRGITEVDQARAFLSPKLTDLIDPTQMPGITEAVKRIRQAVEQKERIAIYGDYDVDGITSTAILFQLFTMLEAPIEYYIPHRIEEGYGLNDEAITQLAESGVQLIITVDCGVTANQAVELANTLGTDVIITDHHQPGESLPPAVAIVHPGLNDYPNPDSAGAMVAFKLAWAIVNEFKTTQQTTPEMRQFLLNATTLAAMGTVADVVKLKDENRILTSYGLKALSESKLPGIISLIESNDLTGQDLDSYHIGFRLAPMINAAGRLGHARLAVDLLTSQSKMHCNSIATVLKDLNKQRQKCQRDIYKQVRETITKSGLGKPQQRTIVLADDQWHPGVIGIVASRVIDDFYKPTILLNSANENGIAQGSARSIPGFNIHKALAACSEHLVSFGGHKMAAGLKVKIEKIEDFAAALEAYAQNDIDKETAASKLTIDAICPISAFTIPSVTELARLEPIGQANSKPIFAAKGVKWISPPRTVGAKGDHLQIAITDNTASVRCIGFNMGKLEKKLLETDHFSVAYEPQLNHYNGTTTVQFVLTDIKFE